MSDTVIAVSNTPIFDQLDRERGYDPKFPEHLTRPAFAPVWAGEWIARPVPILNPKISETFNPSELIEQAINPQLHIQQIVKKFTAKWPGVTPVHITRLDNIDGTITIMVSKAEMVAQTDESVNAGPKPSVVRPLSEVRPANVPDMITTSKVDFEKKQTSIGEDIAGALYMKPSAWGCDEE
jgi:hypothetical protein